MSYSMQLVHVFRLDLDEHFFFIWAGYQKQVFGEPMLDYHLITD